MVNGTMNGAANGHEDPMASIFPEAHMPLATADPELYGIIEDEKRRQW
jgi:glycine hydroxymethyltransferase